MASIDRIYCSPVDKVFWFGPGGSEFGAGLRHRVLESALQRHLCEIFLAWGFFPGVEECLRWRKKGPDEKKTR